MSSASDADAATAASSPFFYLLLQDNHTVQLAATSPRWGRPLVGVPAAGGFQMTGWQHLAHVLVHRLARHPARTLVARDATCCVVASPAGSAKDCARRGTAVARLRELGEAECPGRPIVVIDGPDADGTKDAVCAQLWSPRSCARGGDDPLVRLTGNVPGLQSEVATGGSRGLCRRLPATPYLSHARSARAAAAAGAARPLRIAYAAASWGHLDAEAHGFVAWRKALRNACKELSASGASGGAGGAGGAGAQVPCAWVWISMSGNGAEQAIQKYARADFCLQPPGDTLPRPGVMDAITTGCVPVLFHPGQATLWPAHWNASSSSVLFDWTGGAPRPRVRDHKAYAAAAATALRSLLTMPDDRLRALQAGVAAAAPRLVYRASEGEGGPSASEGGVEPDAVDVVVRQMRPLRLKPAAAEAAAYARQLEERDALLAAQRSHDLSRGRGRGRGRRAARATGPADPAEQIRPKS